MRVENNADVSQHLLSAFLALEAKQPQEYHLTDVLKEKAARTNWRLVLDGARGVTNCFQGPTFRMSDGLSYLVEKAAE
jgi:hypothetical protein